MYFTGQGVSKSYEKADEWRTRSAADGDPSHQYTLGNIYSPEFQWDSKLDYAKAKEWYSKAAIQGHSYSQYQLGKFYEEGKGVRQDYRTAKEWYGKACDNGDQDGCDKYKDFKFKGY